VHEAHLLRRVAIIYRIEQRLRSPVCPWRTDRYGATRRRRSIARFWPVGDGGVRLPVAKSVGRTVGRADLGAYAPRGRPAEGFAWVRRNGSSRNGGLDSMCFTEREKQEIFPEAPRVRRMRRMGVHGCMPRACAEQDCAAQWVNGGP